MSECNHSTDKWRNQPHPTRAGWIKTFCKCGKWMGDRPEDVKAYRKRSK